MLARWVWMQALGLGTLLMLLMTGAALLSWFVPTDTLAVIVLVLWPFLTIFAIWQALAIRKREVRIKSHKITKPIRLVQISDVHIGSRSKGFLQRIVEQVNTHEPDALLITGDLLDASSVGVDELSPLKQVCCPAYMVIGNHERYVDLDEALSAITLSDVHVVRDTSLSIDEIHLIGVDDRDKPDEIRGILETMKFASHQFSILMYHRPDGWSAALDKNIDLTLAGHTHAGQMWPFGLLVKRQFPNMAGLFTENNQHLFVSTGTGTWGPIFRLGTRSELTIIELEPHNDH